MVGCDILYHYSVDVVGADRYCEEELVLAVFDRYLKMSCNLESLS